MTRTDRLAFFCGIVPLTMGVTIFVLWFFKRWDWLYTAGWVTLLCGSLAAVAGGIALAQVSWVDLRHGKGFATRVWFSRLGCALLFAGNFVVAGWIIMAVISIETRYTVVVRNESQHSLNEARVFGGGCDVDFGSIPPGAVVRRHFWIEQDGSLRFRAIRGGDVLEKEIDPYVTRSSGAHETVVFSDSGEISVVSSGAARILDPMAEVVRG